MDYTTLRIKERGLADTDCLWEQMNIHNGKYEQLNLKTFDWTEHKLSDIEKDVDPTLQ